ncbi:exo-rhamnogalacturonan lyase family protein [Teredinibacter franksiae]|uniref:exo-rhamnogalacturonan lyase family protein n=1 Tax=Teredinibacter franksiae TaxID=2761453 RepID=UPI0016273424|nr:Tat pathway signal sequence domain protein [Teredinibacter franksiae]
MNRRELLLNGALATTLPFASGVAFSAMQAPVKTPKRVPGFLSWLEGQEPAAHPFVTWGQPWKPGTLQTKESLTLQSQNGAALPLQSWPTAYWPDGSVKWTAHAVPANTTLGEQFSVRKGVTVRPASTVKVKEKRRYIEIDTGVITCKIPRTGNQIIQQMLRKGQLVAENARLVGLVQSKPECEPGESCSVESFESKIGGVIVEQSGPVRATIKVTGTHRTEQNREWLPFSLRLYFYAGGDSLRISHSFVFDGESDRDFIRGLGLQVDIPMRDELYNRHIRIVGEGDGIWGESPQGITGLRRDPGQVVRDAQVAGIATPPLKEWDERVSSRMHWIPVWNDVTLTQLNANGFSIRKRTKTGHGWIDSDQGSRAAGVAYVGGVSGGLLMGMRDFWQLHPVQLDVRNAGTDTATATMWFWSPEAPAMDVRFYHDGLGQETHEQQLDALNITYEDYEPGFGEAQGVARTTEMTLQLHSHTPARQDIVEMADAIRQPGQVVAAPEDYLASGVFGALWSLPDRSSPEKGAIEDRLAWSVQFYKQQVDQRHWYGFWNYGDIMHTYDADRHVWRYDVGGYAWDNSELSPDLWLWYSYLRTGDAETFRLAEAMTRHNRDVDIYHLGRFKGFGSRHNVQHWGCSAKQLRISTSAYRRFHYFLTGDERTGDVLDEVINADTQLAQVIPTRKIPNKKPVPGDVRMGVGTDWGSVAANWLTAWERTGDSQYRERLEDAMRTIGGQPYGFFTGVFGYDVENKKLLAPEDVSPGISHLSAVFGLIEICTELNQLLDVPSFKQAWLEYGRYYNASPKEQERKLGKRLKGNSLTVAHSRLTAYVAAETGDEKLAVRAWQEFQREWRGKKVIGSQRIEGPDVLNPIDEAPWLSTNEAAQWGLAAIQNLALVGQALGRNKSK